MSKEDELLDVLNKMVAACKPIHYERFNAIIQEKERDALGKIEREDNRIGIRPYAFESPSEGFAISTLSIIATITDVCLGKRLAAVCDQGMIERFTWYQPTKGDENVT